MYKPKIKLFADGADPKGMFEMYNSGIVSGYTTNPTLMRKAGIQNYKEFAKMVLKCIPDMPISLEVFTDNLKDMEKEAREISSWGDNVYVKIPVTNSVGVKTDPVISKLSYNGIKLNITAILTSEQVHQVVLSLNPDIPSIISVFAGRIADTGRDPIETMRNSLPMIKSYQPNSELLWASTRELFNIIQAKQCGCHIITVTNDILKKLPMIDKDLNQLSLETVQQFKNDAEASGYRILND